MEFYVSSSTDIGIKKSVNQDSILAKRIVTPKRKMAFAVLCDGMGGLTHGEIASGMIVSAFGEWMNRCLPILSRKEIEDKDIRSQWTDIINCQNDAIRNIGEKNGFKIGSTVTAMLLTEQRYYILNIGDSRAYKISGSGVERITIDHTVVENEIEHGNMTETQVMNSPMRSVLTRCVGISKKAEPDMFFGPVLKGDVFMLCSDGFRHLITADEMRSSLYDGVADDPVCLKERTRELIEINKQRGETDNISAVTVYVG